MFSANENIALRQHKRRVVEYVESTIPEPKLDLGISVMVMQVECRTPGCVPVETSIVIVFPRGVKEELIPGVKESGIGGSYKAKILMPLASVTREDVLDTLPPGFEGGRKTWETVTLQCRDFVLGRIGGLVGTGESDVEVEERRILAEFLKKSLEDYLDNDCVAPPIGEPFPEKIREKVESKTEEQNVRLSDSTTEDLTVVQGSMQGGGNFVIRRASDNDYSTTSKINKKSTRPKEITKLKSGESAMDWRRRQTMEKSIQLPASSDSIIQSLAAREHAPGVRSPGCPCCDPDNLENIVEGMTMF